MAEVLHRKFVYIWYYFTIQLRQIFPYWVLGMQRFLLYLAFTVIFSFAGSMIVNILV